MNYKIKDNHLYNFVDIFIATTLAELVQSKPKCGYMPGSGTGYYDLKVLNSELLQVMFNEI